MTTHTLHETPLASYHAEHGASMTPFAGWSMPLHYGSITAEHLQCRRSGAIFDVSHMGRLAISGVHARRLLERVCTRRIGTMEQGQCRYTLVCNQRGGVMDDVIVNRVDDDDFLVVVNAANREKIIAHAESVVADRGWKVKLEDRTFKTAMVAIQGPGVMELIGQVSREIPTLKRYRFTVKNLMILKLMVSRTGYTGEDGVEVILPSSAVGMALKLLLKDVNTQEAEAALKPAGLGARDTLRLEAGMPLYGNELAEDTSALEAGLGFAISLDKNADDDGETFIGQEALIAERDAGGPKRRLVGLDCEGRRCPRPGMAVEVGGAGDAAEPGPGGRSVVTSGCVSPTLERPIAMAYVPVGVQDGAEVVVGPERAEIPARVRPLPFYKA